MNLGTQIKEDHLTCSICLNGFRKPKALPCLHTFCELCLQDYVVSRSYESTGKFPCPLCRVETSLPPHGIQHFPDNHLVSSLSDTVDQLQPHRPIPKPRRSLGLNDVGGNLVLGLGFNNQSQTPSVLNHDSDSSTHISEQCQSRSSANDVTETECSAGPDDFEMVDKKEKFAKRCQYDDAAPNYNTYSQETPPPPPYSSVADTHPDENHIRHKVCVNDTEQSWMVVPSQSGISNPDNLCPVALSANVSNNSQQENANHRMIQTTEDHTPHGASNYTPCTIGWNTDSLDPSHSHSGSGMSNSNINPGHGIGLNQQERSSSPLYPSVPIGLCQDTACIENLMLSFGKQGSTARDFIKPTGLAVSKEGHYIISDNGGDQNRFLVFNSGGDITTAFKCGCKVKDIALTENNEIIAAIHKANSAIRRFTLNGQLKGEYGKFFTFEETSGIAELTNKGIVLTGVSGHCVYVLTNQMKLQTKFGRKGNGDGYFSHPGFVAVDSRNQIIVSDKVNNCIQVFSMEGKFRLRFGSTGKNHGQLQTPMGVCVDSADNIIVADSGNFRVEAFSAKGRYLCSIVRDTWQLGENVKPMNVSMTPTGKIVVLLRGPYFAEVRVYSSRHADIPQDVPNVSFPKTFESAMAIPKNLGIWPSK